MLFIHNGQIIQTIFAKNHSRISLLLIQVPTIHQSGVLKIQFDFLCWIWFTSHVVSHHIIKRSNLIQLFPQSDKFTIKLLIFFRFCTITKQRLYIMLQRLNGIQQVLYFFHIYLVLSQVLFWRIWSIQQVLYFRIGILYLRKNILLLHRLSIHCTQTGKICLYGVLFFHTHYPYTIVYLSYRYTTLRLQDLIEAFFVCFIRFFLWFLWKLFL